ncbi:C6 transcription factor [Penicillium odoratum]|uniref:C6 transcription factor n=1 Tax=Penicillium odoratum TaxID=1167516 RepID=UPI0025468B7D|nr:C6 transcription factor [Penicillium odoratum]KAJ5761071.1 C6 transcription factor [Penicillium odoratum]
MLPLQSQVSRPLDSYSLKEWKGVEIHDTPGAGYYGPLSSSYFGARMSHFLANVSKGLESAFQIGSFRLNYPPTCHHASEKMEPNTLSRAQEQYFLDLLWQSFHCVYPIIVEPDFRIYYEYLWERDQVTRRPSPLVDSLLAVCMQYGATFLMSDENDVESDGGHHVATVSKESHAFFRRAQTLLLDQMESPSIMALQSHIYCIVYLHNTSFFNAAYSLLGTAVRVAQSLRLHLPRDTSIQKDQDLYQRLWHTLFVLDCQLSMVLGRPLVTRVEVNLDLPGDTQEHALLSGSMLMIPGHEEISWLTFHVQSTRLLTIAQSVQIAFYQQGARLIEQKNAESIYCDLYMIEELAACLAREVGAIYDWTRHVPPSLQNCRVSGEPFSTKRIPINFDTSSPLWLQRQRILLELLYHHLQLSTFRSFLRFPPGNSSITPLSDCHSINCLNHAVALTNLLHQVLTETDLLRGWNPVFQYQWDAALCTLGFVLANPVCPPTPAARKSIQTAIHCFEIMGKNSVAARTAAEIVREAGIQAETLVEKFHNSLSARGPPTKQRAQTSAAVQVMAAPALTPEYLQSLEANQSFKIGDFVNDLSTGDILAFDASKFPGITDDVLSTMELPWENDEVALDSFSLSLGNTM